MVVPVPVRLTDCGEFEALPETVRIADSAVAALGAKVTWIVQLAAAAKLAGQVFAPTMKSLALGPLTLGVPTVMAEAEALVTVTVWLVLVVLTCWFPKATVAGVSCIEPPEPELPAATPVPSSATVCVEGDALSDITRLALRLYRADGVNTTLMAQEVFAATCVPQVLVWLKSLADVPVIVMPATGMFNGPVPVLVRVTVAALEEDFSC